MSDNEKFEDIVRRVRDPNVSHDQVMGIYTKWAPSYDEHLETFNYLGPQKVASLAEEVVGGQKDAKILDLAAGTGLCGIQLQKLGFLDVDALDASQEMLNEARKKGIYKNLICDKLGSNRLGIEDNTYDVATIVGAFTPGHVNGSCLEEVARIIKPGGYFVGVFAECYLETNEDVRNVEPSMKQLEKAGVWRMEIRRRELYHDSTSQGIFFALKILAK